MFTSLHVSLACRFCHWILLLKFHQATILGEGRHSEKFQTDAESKSRQNDSLLKH